MENTAKRRAWESTGEGEALPALPSGLDEEDRKRIRSTEDGEEVRDEGNKRIRVADDIAAMNDQKWEEYKDEICERRRA